MELPKKDRFRIRHIGTSDEQELEMLEVIGVKDLDTLIDETIPSNIRMKKELRLPVALSEFQYLEMLRSKARKNELFNSMIGLGYHRTITPSVILRNIFENPGWYTQYTPYQAEISQGRLEALLNFQTMVSDLTGLPIANASLLDEGTAAAEAMHMFFAQRNKRKVEAPKFFVSEECLPQTIDVLKTRSKPVGIELVIGNHENIEIDDTYFGALLQYPSITGEVYDYEGFIRNMQDKGGFVCLAADIMSLVILKSPGELGADAAIGTTQRFGVPMGYGGPHAAYFACTDDHKRVIPGRIIGVSVDRFGNRALRMALQTREQHIRRDKATSNICTAQALLAIMAGMYAVYHGSSGLKRIAYRIHLLTRRLSHLISKTSFEKVNTDYFDTLTFRAENAGHAEQIRHLALGKGINLRIKGTDISIAVDETTDPEDILNIANIFAHVDHLPKFKDWNEEDEVGIPEPKRRQTDFLTHPVFNTHHSETKMMRYIKTLENKDLSLTKSMIPLGSCTMKLNAATELMPVSWPEFSALHPFAPANQALGYLEIIHELENYLSEITGFYATSLQPNSGAQGEYAGLMVIRAYHEDNGEANRNVILIPESAHGTNPASAVMAGMKVVVVKCDKHGNIDFEDLEAKADEHSENLAGLMVTYPSTHGVFEDKITQMCEVVHKNGGQVYMDGANMNAQVGLTSPALIGADVCHLNLHKTFAIPHGGGGPGMGPICVAEHLASFLPGNPLVKTGGDKAISSISAAPFGSASILLISYAYIRLLGQKGVTNASRFAILNANYIKARLEDHYEILYSGKDFGRVAHELIIDCRPFKKHGIEVEDIAKRLIDFGFHAPTMSWPVPGTLMIEPTESEDKDELDRFCEAMIQIRSEISAIEAGKLDAEDNPLKNSPHILHEVTGDEWNHKYSRQEAAFPLPWVMSNKFWASSSRVNNSYGDRHLVCTCPPISEYQEEPVEA